MKNLVGQFTCLVMLVSCNVEQIATHISSKIDGSKISGTSLPSAPNKSKDKIKTPDSKDKNENTKYLDRMLSNCESDISNETSTVNKETLYVSKDSVDAVKADLNKYVSKNGKRNLEDFWMALSTTSIQLLNDDLIKQYSQLDDSQYVGKQKLLAYAFLYFLEEGKAEQAYRLTSFQDYKATHFFISFAGSTEVQNVGTCGALKSFEIKLPERDLSTPLIQCSGDQRRVVMTLNSDEDFVLKVKSTKNSYDIKVEQAEVEFLSRGSRNLISYDLGMFDSPQFKIELNKKGNFLEKLKLKNNRTSKLVLKNLKCRTFVPFEFE